MHKPESIPAHHHPKRHDVLVATQVANLHNGLRNVQGYVRVNAPVTVCFFLKACDELGNLFRGQ